VERQEPRSLESLLLETRGDVRHLETGVTELRQDVRELRQEVRGDIRRLDGRVDQILLVQVATLLTALGSLATVLVTALA
jgi:hypothetical protein